MEQESRIEKIFEALKNKVPVTQINELFNEPQVLSVNEIGQQSDMEVKVIGILSGLEMIEKIEKPIVQVNARGKNTADLVAKTKKSNGLNESLAIIIRPGRGGIRRYRSWFRNTYNLDPEQVDEYLKMKK